MLKSTQKKEKIMSKRRFVIMPTLYRNEVPGAEPKAKPDTLKKHLPPVK